MSSNDLQPHPVHAETGINQFDVFIAGSGPVGATFARLLVDAGYNVVVAEIGDQDTREPAAHKKNEIEYQKDIDRFVRVIQGALSPVSVPISKTIVPILDPKAWTPDDPSKATILNGRNPHQQEYNNLGAQAVTRGVGGMATHWTCATPEFRGIERPQIFQDNQLDDGEWAILYQAARRLLGTSTTEFDESIRHNVVLDALQNAYPERNVQPLPLACRRIAPGSPYVHWNSAAEIFGDIFTNSQPGRGVFKLLTNTRCTKLFTSSQAAPYNIDVVEVKDLLLDRYAVDPDSNLPVIVNTDFAIRAKVYVIAAGAVATPQILANSNFGGKRSQIENDVVVPIPNVGRYITEQPMAFCQVVMLKDLVEDITNYEKWNAKFPWWETKVRRHIDKYHETDALPIPFQDPEPQVTIPALAPRGISEEDKKDITRWRPWHTQIHRDAFSYGEVGPQADPRVVVDLRWFGMQSGDMRNRIIFEDITDAYGMPQPTFEYLPTPEHATEAHNMMADMTEVASKLGGYLPGSYPQFMTPGLALHLGGTTRLGQISEIGVTVGNYNSQVWDFNNLYVGGNGVIPTPFAANPTLTSLCLALRAVLRIKDQLSSNTFLPPALNGRDVVQTPSNIPTWPFTQPLTQPIGMPSNDEGMSHI